MFPRYSLGNADDAKQLLNLFKRDFWNSFGKDVSANDGVLAIEDWPEP